MIFSSFTVYTYVPHQLAINECVFLTVMFLVYLHLKKEEISSTFRNSGLCKLLLITIFQRNEALSSIRTLSTDNNPISTAFMIKHETISQCIRSSDHPDNGMKFV